MSKQREYRLSDLSGIASQLGLTVHMDLIPRELCEPRLSFDLHALAMALRLADLVERSTYVSCIDGRTPNGDRFYNGERMPGKRPVAGWLRNQVERELGRQP